MDDFELQSETRRDEDQVIKTKMKKMRVVPVPANTYDYKTFVKVSVDRKTPVDKNIKLKSGL